MLNKKKSILIVDDSALMRRLISDIINSDDRFSVKDMATNGLEALDLIVKNRLQYDAVILDINMPKMNGLELLEELQKLKVKIRVIVVSTVAKEGAKETLIALERGAFDFVTKPENYLDAKEEKFKKRLISILCVAADIQEDSYEEPKPYTPINTDTFTKRVAPAPKAGETSRIPSVTAHYGTVNTTGDVDTHITSTHITVRPPKGRVFKEHKRYLGSKSNRNKLVAIACSTGGPKSLQEVIPKISKAIDAPILLVQHMPKGFTATLASRLDELSQVKVKEAKDGDILEKGCVYIAPGGSHMQFKSIGRGKGSISITDEPAIEGLKPCANIMYNSLRNSDFDEITCVIMTGMGADGTLGVGELGEHNNIYVIAQDESTSVVYGMPKSVAEAKLVDQVVPLNQIADAILKNVGVLSDGR